MTAQTILPANTLSSGFDVANSLRFDGSSSYLSKTNSGTGSENKSTFSAWIKICGFGDDNVIFYEYESSGNYIAIKLKSGNIEVYAQNNASAFINIRTNRALRDFSAWYHLVVAIDSTQGTAANRVKIYINGVQETSLSSTTYPPQNQNCKINQNNEVQAIGGATNSEYYNGYIAQAVWIDNAQLDPTSFGEADEDSGIWKPISVSGLTFGTLGWFLEFKESGTSQNSSGLGADTSGNDIHFAATAGLAATDQTTDTCTNNFAILNARDTFYVDGTLSEGNCKYVGSSGNYDFVYSTIQVSKGKWYFEGTYKAGDSDNGLIGITGKAMTDTANYLGKTATHEFAYIGNQGRTVTGGSFSTSGSYDAFTHDDVIGVAVDLDNNKIYYSKNGTFQNSGDPTSGATGTGALAITAAASTTNGSYALAVSSFDSDDADEWEVNFGNPVAALSSAANDGNGFGSFEYAPPSGYLALCTKNLATDG